MSLFVASLNSGSNGNCYYVGNEDEAVLIDAGISCRETENRLKRLDLDIRKIKALFISHEHTDHISGVNVLAKKYQLPVYVTPRTLQNSPLLIASDLVRSFEAYQPVEVGPFQVIAFPKFHDAIDPHSFVISLGAVRVGVFTDIGGICSHVIQHFRTCHAVFLEANYDEEMLENGRYPYHLKRRIRGGHGHISNKEALALFMEHRPSFMTHLFLSHLSKENNCPDLVHALFSQSAGETKVVVASRFNETGVYRITAALGTAPLPVARPHTEHPALVKREKVKSGKKLLDPFQLSLF